MHDNSNPRISLNKLGEFLIARSARRRRAIIHDQKYPNDAVVPLYRNAFDPIESLLGSGGINVDGMIEDIAALRAGTGSEWRVRDNKCTADALEAFLDIVDQLPVETAEFIRGDNSPRKLLISGVTVSIRPDFLVHTKRRATEYIGAIKLHFIGDDKKKITPDGGQYVAALLHRWLQENNPGVRQPHHAFCYSVDVFRKAVFTGPASTTLRMRDIEAACEEIALRWPSI